MSGNQPRYSIIRATRKVQHYQKLLQEQKDRRDRLLKESLPLFDPSDTIIDAYACQYKGPAKSIPKELFCIDIGNDLAHRRVYLPLSVILSPDTKQAFASSSYWTNLNSNYIQKGDTNVDSERS